MMLERRLSDLVDHEHDRRRLDDRDRVLSDFKAEFPERVHGDGRADGIAAGDGDLDDVVDRADFNFLNRAGQLVSRGDDDLFRSDHDVRRLDDGDGFLSDLQIEIANRIQGDGSLDRLTVKFERDDAVDRAFVDIGDRSSELISCTEFQVYPPES